MSRFYRLDVEPDLFGNWSMVRDWGRIGRAGQLRATPTLPRPRRLAAVGRQRQAKECRGYVGGEEEA
jgi:predicted DNA-binding WGR domain protein